MLLIIPPARTFKQLLIDPRLPHTIPNIFQPTTISPILLPSILPPLLTISLPSPTVAPLSTTPILLPLLHHSHLNLPFLLLPIPPPTLILSHLNHPRFSIFKQYFPLTLKQTFLTWSLLQTISSVSGIIFIL
ncbi:GntT/GntP/DsdX family permease, partial [Staphylococcus epidermidis]